MSQSLCRLRVAAALALAALTPAAAWAAATIDKPVAMLRGLDKITARTQPVEVRVGEIATFGTLSIMVRACRVAPPEDPPENAAFLEITDAPAGQQPHQVFSGWMFSSSPGVSGMDHPVWDVWVIRCADTMGEVDPNAAPEDLGPPASTLPMPQMQIIPPPIPPERLNQ